MTEKKQVPVIVNGKEVMLTEGAVLLQELADKQVQIPHFCYHPGIGVEGSCRLCLVEIKGMPKLATSCTIAVKEGMEVNTHSEPVEKARKGVLEFFLLNHPLDCPFCDKGGECPLQNYTYDSGQFESRFSFEKQHKAKHEVIGEHIILDKERCVLCDRCVRFGRDIAGKEELSIRQRGSKCEIFIPEGTQLTTGYTGNLADICPVGALTSRDFRFQARPWEMKTTDTVCGACSVGCSSQVWRKEAKVLRMTPRIDEEVNQWWLCDKGRFSLKNLLENRVLQPHSFVQGKKYREGQDYMLDLMADLGSGPISVISTSELTNEEFFVAKRLASKSGGNVYLPVSRSVMNMYTAIQSVVKAKQNVSMAAAVEKAQHVVILGESLEEKHPVLALRFRREVLQKKKNVYTVHEGMSEFSDLYTPHSKVDLTMVSQTIDELISSLAHQAKGIWAESTFSKALQQPFVVMLSDQWAQHVSDQQWEALIQGLSQSEMCVNVFGLFEGANIVGHLDQVDEHVMSYEDLVQQYASNQGPERLLWFGSNHLTEKMGPHMHKIKFMIQSVTHQGQQTGEACWILPQESFLEKSGTYTNTFGKVQRLRRSTRAFPVAFDTLVWTKKCLENLFGDSSWESSTQVYQDLAKTLPHYPQQQDAISESKQTYAHYERALWL
ncbi:MAG: 2Fe-2S iron-sulfur cluster-binding protein [Bdellovibrionota bacterium]